MPIGRNEHWGWGWSGPGNLVQLGVHISAFETSLHVTWSAFTALTSQATIFRPGRPAAKHLESDAGSVVHHTSRSVMSDQPGLIRVDSCPIDTTECEGMRVHDHAHQL
jgi:hypothetical protein